MLIIRLYKLLSILLLYGGLSNAVYGAGSFGTTSGYWGEMNRYGFASMEDAAKWGWNNSILTYFPDKYSYAGVLYKKHAPEGAPPADGWTNYWWAYYWHREEILHGPYRLYAIAYRNDRYYIELPNPPGLPDECVGNPCNPATGIKLQMEQDILPTPDGLSFTRYYNSGMQPEGDRSLGKAGWRHNLLPRIDRKFNTAPGVIVSYIKMGVRSSDYLSPEKACFDGWSQIAAKAYRGLLQDAQVSYGNRLCNLSINGKVVASIPVKIAHSRYQPDSSLPLHTVSRPNGKYYTFQWDGTQWREVSQAQVSLASNENGWVFTDQSQQVEIYNDRGLLLSRTDQLGRVTQFSYNKLDLLAQVTGHFGYQLDFAYDESQYLTAATGPDGTIRYTYDATSHRLLSVTYPDNNVKTYHYEDTRFPYHLTGITDENGTRFATWAYDAEGKAILSEHANSTERVEFTYNADGTTTVTETISDDPANPIKAVRTYHFKVVAGQLRTTRIEGDRCSDCANRDMQTREYTASGQLKQVTDWNGNITEYAYNSHGLRESATEDVGGAEMRRTRYEYHPDFPKPTRITRYRVTGNPEVEEPLQVTLLSYTSEGRLARRTLCDPGADGVCDASDPQRTTTWTYNAQGLVTSEDGPRTDVSDITAYEYDAQGNRTRITNALGQVTQITSHDDAGRPREIIDPNGARTQLAYDARGRLTETTTAGATTHLTYDPAGNLIRITHPDGSYLAYHYDAAHRLTGSSDTLGNRINYSLDQAGNRLREEVFDPEGRLHQSQQHQYDQLNRLRQVIGTAGQVTRHDYDPGGNLIAAIDANGHATHQAFDSFNALHETTDALNGVTTYAYDTLGHLTEVTAPNGATTTYDYDGLGNLLREQGPDRGLITYRYDAAGNRTAMTDARGITLQYEYDALNRLTAIITPDTTQDIHFTYDQGTQGVGRLSRMEDESGTTEYTYDAQGNRTGETLYYAEGGQSTWGYHYDTANRLSGITYPGGLELHYDRDAAGQISRVRFTLDGQTTVLADKINYQPFGPPEQWKYGNGLSHQRHHDLDGRLVKLIQGGVLDKEYTHDAVGNLTAILTGASTLVEQTFTYDALDRLDQAIGPWGDQDYDHGPNSNRLRLVANGVSGDYDHLAQSNRLLQTDTWRYERDASGNTSTRLDTAGQGLAFTYNTHNRLAEVSHRTPGQTDTIIAQYRYNGQGERRNKTTAGTLHHYHYGPDGALLAELDHHGRLLRAYIPFEGQPLAIVETQTRQLLHACGQSRAELKDMHLSQPSALHCGAEAIHTTGLTLQPPAMLTLNAPAITLDPGTRVARGAVLRARNDDTATAPQNSSGLYYLHNDHLGTPRAVSDEDQKVVWRWESDPFGNGLPEEDPDGDGQRFTLDLRFPGQYYDGETGLHYNYFRTYDPSTGRYLESDPIGLGGGLNTYAYAGGNPINYVDPLGLESCKGTWVQVGWNRVFNVVCQCVWLCLSCEYDTAWSGDTNSPYLPRTMGTVVFNPHNTGKNFDPESGNDCICPNKPGQEESCNGCKE